MDLHEELLRGVDRRGTHCFKWDSTPKGVIPMFVADMDFPCAEGIMDALRRRLEHPALGYTMHDDADDTALIDYYFRHHGVSVKPEDLVFTPGVVDSLLTTIMDKTMLKLIIWYDNEAGFTNQLLRLITMVAGRM